MIKNDFLKKNLDFLFKIESFLEESCFEKPLIERIMNEIVEEIENSFLKDRYSVFLFLKSFLEKILKPFDVQIDLNSRPTIILIVGINGTGKTNTVAKMANLLSDLDYKTMIIECDNFRHGTFENLMQISKKKDIKILYKESNEGIKKIIERGYEVCVEKKYDTCLIDTSGRMAENKNLMNEILAVKKFLKEINPKYPNDTIFVLDATLGNAALEQIKIFHETLKLTGIILTKTDLAKNSGIVITVCKNHNIPIYGITNGTNVNNIEPFNLKTYVNNFCEPLRELL